MKIALVGPLYPWRGGIAHYTGLLAKHLAVEHEVRAYTFRQQYPAWLYPGRTQTDPSSQPLVNIDARRWLVPWLLPTWIRVSQDWRQWRPELVVLQWWVPLLAPMTAWLSRSARRNHARVVTICHNVLPHERAWFDALLARQALSRASRLVVHNLDDEQRVRRLVPDVDTRVLSFPLFEGFASGAWSRAAARAALGLDGRVLLFFGFVRPYKGLMDLIDALPAVLAELDVTLLVVGECWGDSQGYRERVARSDLSARVQFVDRYVTNDEAEMYFAAADLAVLPYRSATGSAVLQLAFGFGVPVVGTRTGGIAEIVEDGATGFLVEPGDPSALSSAIIRFFCQGRGAEFRAAIAERRSRFDWEPVVSAIVGAGQEQSLAG